MTAHHRITPLRAWLMAARPKTLPTAVSPVIVGSAAAAADRAFSFPPAVAALTGALLLQIGVNIANDYFDYIKGVDGVDRLGPLRVTQGGLLSPGAVWKGLLAVIGMVCLVGGYLIAEGGTPIAVIGACAVGSLLAYSGGPFPLASHGLGDLFVFVFYGPVAVCGTYWVQAHALHTGVILLSYPVGFLITAVLVVNNFRDIPTDRRSGKQTLAVMLGPPGTQLLYRLVIGAAYVMLLPLWVYYQPGWALLLPLLTIPLAVRLGRTVRPGAPPAVFNRALAHTAMLALVFGLLLAAGVVLS